MNIKFEILFIVELLHDYFADLACEDLDITPTPETARILRGHNLLMKMVGNKLVVLTNVDNSGKPVISLDAATRLSFYAAINNVRFCNYTNIDYRPAVATKYYFTNLNQTKAGPTLYLSSGVFAYNSANSYTPGMLASNGSGNTYEAIKSSSNANQHALNETAYWLPRGTNQYVNANDKIFVTGDNYTVSTAAAKDFTINIYGLNIATSVYDNLVSNSTQHFDSPQTSVTIDFSALSYARYKIDVNGTSSIVYYDSIAAAGNIFGIIDIFNTLPTANNFSLFDAAGLPKQSTFTLRFANRYTIWKYIARTTDVTAIKDNAAVYTFTNVPASKTFLSSAPMPFSETPVSTLFLESVSLGHVTPVPNPTNERLTVITQGGDNFFCAEKYLNY